MSTFGDYKSYRNFAPKYQEWKAGRDLAEAKRIEYLKRNPKEIKQEDIQKSKAILRAIDIMDEYSQKRAEDMEVATETVVGTGLEIAASIGAGLGFLVTLTKPVKNLIKKHSINDKKLSMIVAITSMVGGGIMGTIAAFPLFAWAAKAEVKASRKGRFEAINKDLKDPKVFASLSSEQETQLNEKLKILSTKKEKKNPLKNIKESYQTIKNMVFDSKEYLMQRYEFEKSLKEDEDLFNKELTKEEIEDAKMDQQLLTKLVEKIDIASQDYAENAELAISALITTAFAFGALFSLGYEKIAKHFKWKQSSAPAILGMLAMLGSSIAGAQIQKQASRVGRFKIKQELMKNPEQLVYVPDEKTGEIVDVEIKTEDKLNILKFLKEAWKNNKEFEKWQKTEGLKEKKIAQALENIEFTEEQLKEAKRLQHNTFKTFNKIDENSQKYSESIEALGQAIQYPLSLIFGAIGVALGIKHLDKMAKSKTAHESSMAFIKYFSTIMLSSLPSIGINAYITKEQKKASKVAHMLTIEEMKDYKNFVDYSRFK